MFSGHHFQQIYSALWQTLPNIYMYLSDKGHQARGQLPTSPSTWHQTFWLCLEAQGQGVALQRHLANSIPSKQLQPLFRDVSTLSEGEVVDHVQAGHCLPQHEERDLRQLPPQSKQAAGKVLVYATVFSLSIRFFLLVRKLEWCFPTWPCFNMPDDFVHCRTHETVCCK